MVFGGASACGVNLGEDQPFRLNYILASSMYGRLPIADVLAEVRKTGAESIDIWPEQHANHREQIEDMGREKFAELLRREGVRVGIYTCYRPGLAQSPQWMPVLREFGGSMIVTGAGGPKDLTGGELRSAIKKFARSARPAFDKAAELGVRIALENHGGALLSAPESLLMMMEAIPDRHVGIAFAPYHLPQSPKVLGDLIGALGDRLMHFYAWEHGEGSSKPLPMVLQMKQMPGCGPLDFAPLLGALRRVRYAGWTSIFMHPVPRGAPILPEAGEVTAAINRSREYLEYCLASI